jgi:hypothetical protein
MRLLPFLLALGVIAQLNAQTKTPAATKLPQAISTAFSENTGSLQLFGENPAPSVEGQWFLQPSPLATFASVCSVPLTETPIGTPDRFESSVLIPPTPERMPSAPMPAPPCH